MVSLGFLAGTLIIEAQSGAGGGGGGAGGAGGGAGGAAGGAAASGAAGTASAGAVSGGAAAGRAGGAAPGGSINTVGGNNIAGPSGPTVGNASALQTTPNTIGGAPNSGGITGIPSGPSANATLPSGAGGTTAGAVQFNTLPAQVQGTLQGFSANGALGSVTPVPGRAGTFRATVTQNGVPTELIVGANGQVLSRSPVTGSAVTTAGTSTATDAAALGNVQAGIPLTSLPPALQSSIQSQLGGAQVQSISRDDLANGSVLRVTTTQNGVPTELRFAANGTLLSASPLAGTATSAFGAGTGLGTFPGGAAVLPPGGGAVVMDDLPNTVQTAVRGQLGELQASRIMQQRTANGVAYVVNYDQNGRQMTMVVGPDGRIVSNGPTNVGAAPARATASAASDTNAATRTTAMKLDDLPDKVENVLKQSAPYAEVRTISREQRVGGDVYVIAVRDEDRAGEITIDANGRIINDSRRDLSALTPRAPIDFEEKPEGMPYDRLPVAIQNAVKAYAPASDIRSITLGLDRDGRTIYDVIFYRDGRRDRMIVRKDGMLARIEENVSAALEVASANKPPVLAIGDLPSEVQDTIRRQTDNVLVKEINTKEVANETVYQVKYDTNGAPVELLVSKDGAVIVAEGEAGSEAVNAPLQAAVDREEEEVVRVIDGTAATERVTRETTAAGASAARERGTAVNAAATSSQTPVTSKVNLNEAPEPVQNTAKKLAGTATIDSITPKVGGGGVMYEVNFLENGVNRSITLDSAGVVQRKTDLEP